MNISIVNKVSANKPMGFTLLEVLVAMALGVGILTATVSMQMQHQKGFKLSSNKLEMQTNAKFAFEFIGKSLRGASSAGCRSSQILSGGVTTPTEGCYKNVCTDFIGNAAFADFRPGREVLGYEYTGGGLSPLPPNDFTFISGAYYSDDSDIISIAGGFGEVYNLAENQNIDVNATGFQLDMNGVAEMRLKQFQYGMLSSCSGVKFFKVTSSEGDIATGNIQWAPGSANDDNLSGILGSLSEISLGGVANRREFRRAATTSYFVGMNPFNDLDGVPTLYQDVDGISKSLIEGVEEMQLLYGVSASPDVLNVADRYDTAQNITDWSQVVSVRIGFIMRSPVPVYTEDKTQNMTLECVGYSQATKIDRYSRSTYCAEVSLRNRVYGVRVRRNI